MVVFTSARSFYLVFPCFLCFCLILFASSCLCLYVSSFDSSPVPLFTCFILFPFLSFPYFLFISLSLPFYLFLFSQHVSLPISSILILSAILSPLPSSSLLLSPLPSTPIIKLFLPWESQTFSL